MIRNESKFDEKKFLRDFSEHHGHASLKKEKVTRPPAPWLKSGDISQLQMERNYLRYQAHWTKSHVEKVQRCTKLARNKDQKGKGLFYLKALPS